MPTMYCFTSSLSPESGLGCSESLKDTAGVIYITLIPIDYWGNLDMARL